MTRARPRARLRVAAGAALAAVLVLVGAELVLRRAAGPPPLPVLLRPDALGTLAPHPTRAFTAAAHVRAAPAHAGPYANGAWPFRGRPPEPAPDDVVRVVLLGDSCAYGIGVQPAETLAERLHAELARRGADPARLQVVNLGVPAYSLAQIAALAEELLPALAPAAVVLSTSLWNEQSPALGAGDEEVLARAAARGPLARALAGSALARALRPRAAPDVDALVAAWERGAPVHGTRVPAERVAPLARALVSRARDAGARAVVVVPPLPAETRARRPRLAADAASLRAAALAAGAAIVDGEAALRASGLADDALFVDFVHPAPPALELLARAAADELAALAERAAAPEGAATGDLRVLAVEPREAPALGDVRLAVEVAGWRRDDGVPAITVGGAPLLDVRALGGGRFEGLLGANAAGAHDVVVSTPRGADVLRGGLLARPPRLERAADGVRLVSRPGDRARVLASGGAARERWSPQGAWVLDPERALPDALDLVCGADGTAEVALPRAPLGGDGGGAGAGGDGGGALLLQALVLPRGLAPGSPFARATPALVLGDG